MKEKKKIQFNPRSVETRRSWDPRTNKYSSDVVFKHKASAFSNLNGERCGNLIENEIDRAGFGTSSGFCVCKHKNNKITLHYFNPLAFAWEKISLSEAKTLLAAPIFNGAKCKEMIEKHFPNFTGEK